MNKITLISAALSAAVSLGATVTAQAAPVKIDATHLDAISLYVVGTGIFLQPFPASTVKKLDLPEGSFSLRYNSATAPVPSVSFEVTSSGLIDFDAAQDAYVSGRGTDTLVVRGLAISLDVTALDTFGPNILAVRSGVFSSGTATVHLLPGGHRLFFQTGAASPRLVFYVTQKGTVDAVEVWDADAQVTVPGDAYVASGLGTDSLVVKGTPITVDASALSTRNPQLNGISSSLRLVFNSEHVAQVSVLPGGYFFYYNPVSRTYRYPRMFFTVRPDGTIGAVTVPDYDPRSSPLTGVNKPADHLVSGRGTTRLNVLGAPVNVIVAGSADQYFYLWDLGVFPEMAVHTVHLLPGGHRLSEPTGPAGIDFDFLVRASGLVDYVDGAAGSAILSGRGTDTLVVGRCACEQP